MMVENTDVGIGELLKLVNFGKCSPVFLFAPETIRATEFLFPIDYTTLFDNLTDKN